MSQSPLQPPLHHPSSASATSSSASASAITPIRGASSRAIDIRRHPSSSSSSSHQPQHFTSSRAPIRIALSPPHNPINAGAGVADSEQQKLIAASSSAPTGRSQHMSAREKSERGKLFDDEFRLKPRQDEEETDEEEDIAAAASSALHKQPFITHSYQSPMFASNVEESPSPIALGSSSSKVSESLSAWFKAFMLPLSIVLSVGNSITWKRMLNRYASVDGSGRNLEFFVNQWTLTLYTIVCGTVFAYRWWFTDIITPEQRAYPKKRFALMGLLDAVAGLFGAVGGSITSGQVQIVINQANIPLTMFFSRFYLHITNYTWSQYIGAGVIIAGGLVSAFNTSGETTHHIAWYGSLLIFIAVIPGSMSNVYKEENFKEYNLDVFYLSTYVSIWQAIMSFACIPLFTLPYFGGIPLLEMPQNLLDGWHCFLGEYLEGYLCHTLSPSSSALVFTFVTANFLYNLVLLMMVKHGSALFLVIACAMALPLTNIVFTSTWIMGDDVEEFSVYNMIGLALVVIGFLLYSVVTPSDADGDQVGEFMIPTGPAFGHSMYLTEYFPSVNELDFYYDSKTHEPERRHSFDFHSSPSIRSIQDARKKRVKKLMKDKTPSRTP